MRPETPSDPPPREARPGVSTSEVAVGLTDCLLGLECLLFVGLLWTIDGAWPLIRLSIVGFFVFTALASLTGGAWHLWFSQSSSVAATLDWKATMLALGATSLSAWAFGACLLFVGPIRRRVIGVALFAFAVYSIHVAVIDDHFRVAIINYAPAVVFLGAAFAARYRRYSEPAILAGLLGLGVTVVAAIVQLFGVSLHPVYFNPNATYHVIQAIGLFLIFRAAVFFVRNWPWLERS